MYGPFVAHPALQEPKMSRQAEEKGWKMLYSFFFSLFLFSHFSKPWPPLDVKQVALKE